MSVSLGRALTAVALVASLGLGYHSNVGAAQPDKEMRINIVGGAQDKVNPYLKNPPKGFSSLTFNDARWPRASASPCADLSWAIPQGAGAWLWASTCSTGTASVTLRRSFVVPAQSVLSGRLSLAVHGVGSVYLNGKQIGVSVGNPILLDVTSALRLNGAKNVLALAAGALNGDTGLGIAYNVQLILSANQFTAFTRTHRYTLPSTLGPSIGGGGVPTPVATASAQGVCSTSVPSGVVPIFSPQIGDSPTATGWAHLITAQHVYVVTRLLDLSKIQSPTDMPSAKIAGQLARANAIISDDQTGIQVLDLPPNPNIGVLSIGNPHNQLVGQSASVTGFSRVLNCMAAYSPTIVKYIDRPDGSRVAQINSVVFQDAADGGVAFDGSGNLLGVVIFDAGIVDAQGNITPLILPASTALPVIDHLIAVLQTQQTATAGQHTISVVTAADGSQSIVRTDGSAAPAATGTPAATPSK